jgi:predicted site-specific integrase-resolvase
MIENLFNKYGCEIIVLNEIDDSKQIEKELFEEIITLLHCFSMKMYSNRRKEKLNLIKKELELESNLENIE